MEDVVKRQYDDYLEKKLDIIFGIEKDNVETTSDSGTDEIQLSDGYHFNPSDGFLYDKDGKRVNSIRLDNVWDYHGDYARVYIQGRGYNYIDKNGELLCENYWGERSRDFCNGFAAVYDSDERRYNYIDTEGRTITNEWFNEEADDFNDGFAVVCKSIMGKLIYEYYYNIINSDGKLLLDEWIDRKPGDFSCGWSLLINDSKYNYVNPSGKLLFSKWKYNAIGSDFVFGRAAINIDNSVQKFAFIDTEGNLIDDKEYGDLKLIKLNDKYAYLQIDDKATIIDSQNQNIFKQWYQKVIPFNKKGYDDPFYRGYDDPFYRGYVMVRKNYRYNLIDTEGNLLYGEWFDFIDPFFLSNKEPFYRGYSRVKKYGKYNFIDFEGNFLSNTWFAEVNEFFCGYSRVKKYSKYNFIDINGNLLSDTWFDDALPFIPNGRSETISGNPFRDDYFTENEDSSKKIVESSFDILSDSYAHVMKDGKTNVLDTSGHIVLDKWYDKVSKFNKGFALVEEDGKWNIINTKGDLLHRWFDPSTFKGVKYLSSSFLALKLSTGTVGLAVKKDLKGYLSKHILFSYYLSNGKDSFKCKHEPINIIGDRFVLCLDKNFNVLLFDRENKEYKNLGTIKNIQYNDSVIFNKESQVAYLIYDNQLIDISTYFNKHFSTTDELKINPGLTGILTIDEFRSKNKDEIDHILEEEKEKEKERKIRERQTAEREKIEKASEQDEIRKKNAELERTEATNLLIESLKILDLVDKDTNKITRISVNDVLVKVDDHYEINPFYVETGLLKHIDFRSVPLINVKLSGLNLSNCNISLNPQTVYKKDLRNCILEGVYIGPFTDFSGVDIRGAKLGRDSNPLTDDTLSSTVKRSIYDENTTYNGVPVQSYIEGLDSKTSGKK